MFARVKKSGKYQYLQIVENKKEDGKVKQRVLITLGRMDQLNDKGTVETLTKSLSRFSEKQMLILSSKKSFSLEAKKIGPALIFNRLWEELGIKKSLKKLLKNRCYEFDVERAIFMTVLHRLMVSGSDRFCNSWRDDYVIKGTEKLELHHLYRAMSFLGEKLDFKEALTARYMKDGIEENLFEEQRDLFSQGAMVFFDTTSIYFEGEGGQEIGERGFSKDHRSDLKQMVVGVIMSNSGRPLCCEMWPGNTADVKTLIPITKNIGKRFGIEKFCIVADRGMVSENTIHELESNNISYIFGARMRAVKTIRNEILSDKSKYIEVHKESENTKDPAPLKVKEVLYGKQRYIVCINSKQARKDALTRKAMTESLEEKIKKNAKALVGNKGYRKYIKFGKNSVCIDSEKVKNEERFDGKWVLVTNTELSAKETALKYKELWQVERVFRDMKSLLETRPIYHRLDRTIRGHVFCSFLALVLRKELDERLEQKGYTFEWAEIKQDLKALQEITVDEQGKKFALRTDCKRHCGKIFQAVGLAIPPSIRSLS